MSDMKPKRGTRTGRSDTTADVPAEIATEVTTVPSAAAAEPAPPSPAAIAELAPALTPPLLAPPRTAADDAPWGALAESQAALTRGLEKAAVEMTGMTRSGIAAANDAAVALLGARTFAEAVEINAGLARRGVDAMIEGSARLSEIGVKAVTEASRPILSQFAAAWKNFATG